MRTLSLTKAQIEQLLITLKSLLNVNNGIVSPSPLMAITNPISLAPISPFGLDLGSGVALTTPPLLGGPNQALQAYSNPLKTFQDGIADLDSVANAALFSGNGALASLAPYFTQTAAVTKQVLSF